MSKEEKRRLLARLVRSQGYVQYVYRLAHEGPGDISFIPVIA